MRTRTSSFLTIALLGACLAAPAFAQSGSRDPGFEFGFDINWLLGKNVDFDGGSTVDVEDDFGIGATFGYRVNSRFEIQGTLDWSTIDYDANLVSAQTPGLELAVSGEMETFSLMAKGVYNFVDGPLTPFIAVGAGWSWIDTNIPTGSVQVGCWWDPWWGQVCAPYQNTKSVDGFRYSGGLGVRWDTGPGSLRASWEMHWIDLDNASSTPQFDQFRLGYTWRF